MFLFYIAFMALQIILAHGAPQDRGIFRFDCATAGEACQNACFYMYCANPNPNGHVFRDGGNDPNDVLRSRNRRQSGAEPSGGPPCRVLPFSQKLYDTYPNWNRLNEGESLQTDEFPLAAWQQNNFVANAWPPRNTLRCIPGTQNGNAGGQYRSFRQGQGSWGPESQDPRAAERLGPNTGQARRFTAGDWFQVAFMNVDERLLPACRQVPDCSNTGPARQFHMTNKRNADGTTTLNPPGIIRWPYDPMAENTYEITDTQAPHANRPIRMLKMEIRRGGGGGTNYAVRIFAFSRATGWQQVSRDVHGGPGPYAQTTDEPFTIPANPGGPNLGLPLAVTIDPSHDPHDFCGKLYFNYGNPGTSDAHAYSFHSGQTGISTQTARQKIHNPGAPRPHLTLEVGPYCTASLPQPGVREWTCYFPAS